LGSFLIRSQDRDGAEFVVFPKKVYNPGYQRCFRSYDNKVNTPIEDNFFDRLKIEYIHFQIDPNPRCAGITGTDIQFFALRTLSQFPGQGMLTPTTSK